MRIGMDRIRGVITDLQGAELVRSKQVDLHTVEDWKDQSGKILLDVRSLKEYRKEHIPGAQHYFLGDMRSRIPEELKNKTIMVHCQSGDRASIATSYLESQGFKNVYNFPGSFLAWKDGGKTTVSAPPIKRATRRLVEVKSRSIHMPLINCYFCSWSIISRRTTMSTMRNTRKK